MDVTAYEDGVARDCGKKTLRHPGIREEEEQQMRKIYMFVFFLTVCCIVFSGRAEATRMFDKRLSPESVAIVDNGIKYMPRSSYDPKKGRIFYIEAWDAQTQTKLWEQKIYEIQYDLTLEHDVQDRLILSLRIKDGKLIITNEGGDQYELDLNTREVTKK